jgi:hypothetical protein
MMINDETFKGFTNRQIEVIKSNDKFMNYVRVGYLACQKGFDEADIEFLDEIYRKSMLRRDKALEGDLAWVKLSDFVEVI